MTVVCHSCSTKYPISDRKIAGAQNGAQCERCGELPTIGGGRVDRAGAEPGGDELRDQRNESSVLFSTRSLPGVNGFAIPRDQPTHARNEGSGLLDIRELSRGYNPGDRAAPEAIGDEAGSQPIPVLITDDQYTPPALVLPRLPATDEPKNRLIWALCGVAGALAVAAVMLSVIVVKGGDGAKSYASAPERSGEAGDALRGLAATGERAAAGDSDAEAPGGASGASDATSAGADKASAAQSSPGASRARKADRKRQRRKARRSAKARGTEVAEAPARQSESREQATECPDELACVLADYKPACCSKYKNKRARKSERDSRSQDRSSLAERPSRESIKKAMGAVRGRVKSCGTRFPSSGRVTVSVKVGGDGRVKGSTVKSAPTPGLGRCVATAVRAARFTKSRKGASFSYPFVF